MPGDFESADSKSPHHGQTKNNFQTVYWRSSIQKILGHRMPMRLIQHVAYFLFFMARLQHITMRPERTGLNAASLS